MTITVTDFERITGISRHTVYSWFYRDKFPDGISAAPSLGSTKMLVVKKSSKHHDKIESKMKVSLTS
jgi:hypothetical protein